MASDKPTGYLLHSDSERVVIATLESENLKTGDMIQIHILVRDESPVDAVRNGTDWKICGDCDARGHWDQTAGRFIDRWCYVNYAQGEQSVWHCYRRGGYPFLPITRYAEVFAGRKVRFGAYGDPIHIPLSIVRAIVACVKGRVKWTGYTHQWKDPKYAPFREHLMASVESKQQMLDAQRAGWRTFRVRTEGEPIEPGEITCPASDEAGHRTQCERCCLCNGVNEFSSVKSLTLLVHGSRAKNLIQIGKAA